MVVRARGTVDISLDSSVVEHLTSSAEVLGSIPGPAIHYRLCFFLSLYMSILPIPTTIFCNSCTDIENI